MRNAGAARRHVQEPSPPPGGPDAAAELRRAIAGTEAVLGSMRCRDAEMTVIVARLETLGAECGNAGRFALLADKLSTRQAHQVIELISAAEHVAEAREAAEQLSSASGFSAAMYEAAIAEGRRREAEDRDLQPRPAGARHAGRRRHLKLAGGAAVKATAVAAVAAAVTATTMIASQESAAVRHWTPRPAAVRLHVTRPDSAVPFPQSRPFPRSRPSMAAASASPARPAATGPSGPASPAAPAPSVPAAPGPVLAVQRLLELGDSTRGVLPLSAGQAVTWTARATDGITLSAYGGVVVPGQEAELQVTDPSGDGGWVYVSFGGTTVPVEVRSDLGAP